MHLFMQNDRDSNNGESLIQQPNQPLLFVPASALAASVSSAAMARPSSSRPITIVARSVFSQEQAQLEEPVGVADD